MQVNIIRTFLYGFEPNSSARRGSPLTEKRPRTLQLDPIPARSLGLSSANRTEQDPAADLSKRSRYTRTTACVHCAIFPSLSFRTPLPHPSLPPTHHTRRPRPRL